MVKENKSTPAKIDLEKWMKPAQGSGEDVPCMPNDLVMITPKLLPEVYERLKGLSKAERIYQTAIVNAALISYLDKKEKELGYDLKTFANITDNARPSLTEIKGAMPKEE